MAASEAVSLGYGGVSRVRQACGLSRKAIAKGIREIAEGSPMAGRVRRPGAGRKKIVEHDPKLLVSLERLIEPETRGDPESPLRWVCKSTRTLAAQLLIAQQLRHFLMTDSGLPESFARDHRRIR